MDPQASPLASVTPDEIAVCQILLDLKTTIVSLSEILSAFNWGRRRRRFVPHAGTHLPTPHFKPEDDAAAASPDTPLSFSPSDSDDKSNRPSTKKTSKKRSREELIDMIQELTQEKDLLMGKVETVGKYYHKLKAYNSDLKSMKQEVVNTCPKKEDFQMVVNSGTDSSHYYRVNAVSNHPPLIDDPTAERFQFPLGIDLNVPAEEACWPLDVSGALADRRARFAEARRRRRRGLIRIKAMRTACGIRLSTAMQDNI